MSIQALADLIFIHETAIPESKKVWGKQEGDF